MSYKKLEVIPLKQILPKLKELNKHLSFAKIAFTKGGFRHAIFVVVAYIILKLFMFQRGTNMTIGECCTYIQDKEMDGFIREIVEIEYKEERINYFERVFIRKSAKV